MLNGPEHTRGDSCRSRLATAGKAGPVIEINKVEGAVRFDDAVATIDGQMKQAGGPLGLGGETGGVEGVFMRLAVVALKTKLAEAAVGGRIVKVKETGTFHAVEL